MSVKGTLKKAKTDLLVFIKILLSLLFDNDCKIGMIIPILILSTIEENMITMIVEAVKKNNVHVEYVVFQDEGHGFRKKENQINGYGKILEFLNKYLKEEKVVEEIAE